MKTTTRIALGTLALGLVGAASGLAQVVNPAPVTTVIPLTFALTAMRQNSDSINAVETRTASISEFKVVNAVILEAITNSSGFVLLDPSGNAVRLPLAATDFIACDPGTGDVGIYNAGGALVADLTPSASGAPGMAFSDSGSVGLGIESMADGAVSEAFYESITLTFNSDTLNFTVSGLVKFVHQEGAISAYRTQVEAVSLGGTVQGFGSAEDPDGKSLDRTVFTGVVAGARKVLNTGVAR